MNIKIDLHVHTHYSGCSNLRPDRIEPLALENGLNTVAICDHNCVDGALETAALAKFISVIIAEEIVTTQGEIIGYFLNERIPPGLSPLETVSEIKRQGGLVSVPHPFDRLRSSRLHTSALKQILDSIDMIEVFNARNMLNRPDHKLLNHARKLGVVPIVSSDAHLACEIGRAAMVMENYDGPEDFLNKLCSARSFTRKSPLWVHAATKLIRFRSSRRADKPTASPDCFQPSHDTQTGKNQQ
jgi:predicted metal-dependent phosphoesterase TrpH